MKKYIVLTMLILFIILTIMILFFHYHIKSTAKETPPKNVPYLIILGAKVNGTEMSLSLWYRANRALEYLSSNPNTKVIVTGGQGPGENITEAEALRIYLEENGVDKKKILIEDKSTSTFENVKFAKDLYRIEEAVIVSNDFHLYRAIELAEKVGMKGYPLAAKTPEVVEHSLYLREYAAILKMLITGK